MHSIIYPKRNTLLPIFKISGASKEWGKKSINKNRNKILINKSQLISESFRCFLKRPFVEKQNNFFPNTYVCHLHI